MSENSNQMSFQYVMQLSGDSHASPTASPANNSARKTTGTSGRTSEILLPTSDLGLLLVRTCRALIERCLPKSSPTLNHWVTKSGCSVWRLLPLGRRTEGSDDSSSHFWPTPTASEGRKIPSKANFGQIALSNHPSIVGLPNRPKGTKDGKKEQFWPTPTARDYRDGTAKSCANSPIKSILGRKVHDPCTYPVELTPLENGKLNPEWVRSLMGFPRGWLDLDPEARGRLRPARKRNGKNPA